MYCISAPPPRQNGTPAPVATTAAQSPWPSHSCRVSVAADSLSQSAASSRVSDFEFRILISQAGAPGSLFEPGSWVFPSRLDTVFQISFAIIPVNTSASACTTAAKNRNPTSEVPNNFRAIHPKNAVIGGYCTYPHAKCRASSSAINSSRLNPYLQPVARCTTTVPNAIAHTPAIPVFHHRRFPAPSPLSPLTFAPSAVNRCSLSLCSSKIPAIQINCHPGAVRRMTAEGSQSKELLTRCG